MSDQCELCGGEVLTSNDGSDKCCCNPSQPNRECTLDQWTSAEQFNRIQAALALLKRVESGESVVVERTCVECDSCALRKEPFNYCETPGPDGNPCKNYVPKKCTNCGGEDCAFDVNPLALPGTCSQWTPKAKQEGGEG